MAQDARGKGSALHPSVERRDVRGGRPVRVLAREERRETDRALHIITTQANEMMAKVDQMPVILQERDHEAWLDPKNEDTEALQKLLAPYPSEEIRAYPVSRG